jgi:cytochrome c oxidase subunit III
MIPYTLEPRPDTRMTNGRLGIWLFLASEVMLFGALFSSYALLRIAAPTWPSGRDVLNVSLALINTAVLAVVSAAAWRARRATGKWLERTIILSSVAAVGFLIIKITEYAIEMNGGLFPSASTSLAMYYLLTGTHAVHVLGGLAANMWALGGVRTQPPALTQGRLYAITLYWLFVDIVWLIILVLLYFT